MAEPTASSPASILCVDDEPNILAALRRLFRAQGYRILTAESGRAGLEIMEGQKIDLVISDMQMPEMNGAQFLAVVRARWPDTVRLLLSGHGDIRQIRDAIGRGEIFRYISKPWDDEDMLRIVREALDMPDRENSATQATESK